MKKSLACILVFLVLLALSATALAAKPGDTVTVSVSVTANPNHAFSGQIGFKFDESSLEFVSAASSGSDTVMYPTSAKGYFLLQNLSGITTGTKGTITLKVKDGAAAGTYDVTAYAYDFIDVDENPVSVSVAGGSVTVEATACAHTWNDGKVTKEPTCEEAGVKTYTCTKCKQTKTEPVKALNHDKTETITKEATCGADGEKTTTCSRCDFKKTEKIPATGKHTYEGKITIEATCTDKGEMTFTCSVCDDKYTEEINAKGHNPGADLNEKQPTCTKPGYKFFTCTVCGIEVKESEIPPTGKHIYEVTEEVPATCTEDGKRVSACTYEGCDVTQTEKLQKLGHDWTEWIVNEEANTKTHTCNTCHKSETQSLSTYYTMTVCSYGIRFRDLENPVTKDWYMFTPIDLSVEGEQTIDLIAGNMHQIGTATIRVKDGKVTVTTKVNNTHSIVYAEKFLTFLPSLADVTALDFNTMTNYAYGEEISIEEALGGDTKVLLLMRNSAWYEDTAYGVNPYKGKGRDYNAYVDALKSLMD